MSDWIGAERGRDVYLALYTEKGEVAGNGYARVVVWPLIWLRTDPGIVNTLPIIWPTPTPEAWGTITGYGALDSARDGFSLGQAALDIPLVTVAGRAVIFAPGEFAFPVGS